MTILSMTATFGCLENATLTLQEGLNLLEQPNEGGKSTWCAFIRAMFYGLESRKGGAASERNRFTPWSGAAMYGELRLLWQGKDVTLRRRPKGADPFGGFEAVYTGTAGKVPGLTASNVGETILGVSREVYTRTAFISQGGLPVDKSGDLERRVAALATSGEEDVSFSQTEARLRSWRNSRQANRATGRIPKLRAQLDDLAAQRRRVEDAQARAQEAQAALRRLEEERKEVAADLSRHTALQAADYQIRYEKARADLARAQENLAKFQSECAAYGPLPSADALQSAQGDLALLRMLDSRRQELTRQAAEAQAALEEAKRGLEGGPYAGLTGDQAVARGEETAKALAAPHRAHFWHWIPLLAAAVAATVLLTVGQVTGAIHIAVLLGVGGGLLAAGAFVSILLSVLGHKRERAQRQKTLARYGVDSPEGLISAAQRYARRYAGYQEAMQAAQVARNSLDALEEEYAQRWDGLTRLAAPFAPGVTDPAALTAALSRAFTLQTKSQQLRRELSAAQAVWDAASAQGAPAPVEGELQMPVHSRDQDQATLRRLDSAIALYTDQRARAQGESQGLGDPAQLAQEEARLNEELNRQNQELAALNLALDALTAANAQLQTRFSPSVNQLAGRYLSALTGGTHAALTITRDFQALAQAGGEFRPAQFLSQGAADQSYLALRLAICELTLPETDAAPMVLDDALVTFDAQRLANALKLLQKLAENRQVLLFTCQDRERRSLDGDHRPGPVGGEVGKEQGLGRVEGEDAQQNGDKHA